jgi:TatA/E family protein of Tat protein translocase
MFAVINDTGILVVLVALVLLFGASQIPKLARNLGEAGREFRKAHDEPNPPVQVTTPPVAPAHQLGETVARPDQSITLNRAQFEALLAGPRDNHPGPDGA